MSFTGTETEAKKINDDARAANDKLIEEYKKTPAPKVAEDTERARILNQIYNEKFQLPVRETDAQKKAEEAAKKAAEPQITQHQEVKHDKKS